jgi:hypothetical protein
VIDCIWYQNEGEISGIYEIILLISFNIDIYIYTFNLDGLLISTSGHVILTLFLRLIVEMDRK